MDEKNTSCECVCNGLSKGFCIVSVLAALFFGVVVGFLFAPIKHGISDIRIGSGNSVVNSEYLPPPNSEKKVRSAKRYC